MPSFNILKIFGKPCRIIKRKGKKKKKKMRVVLKARIAGYESLIEGRRDGKVGGDICVIIDYQIIRLLGQRCLGWGFKHGQVPPSSRSLGNPFGHCGGSLIAVTNLNRETSKSYLACSSQFLRFLLFFIVPRGTPFIKISSRYPRRPVSDYKCNTTTFLDPNHHPIT